MRTSPLALALLLLAPAAARGATGTYDAQVVIQQVDEGVAAKATLRASLLRMQAEIDARKAEVEKLKKGGGAGAEDAQRSLVEFFKSSQAVLVAEEQATVQGMLSRLGVVAEALRAERGLDAVVRKPGQGEPPTKGVDLTGAMIQAYDAKYPVPQAPYGPLTVNRAEGGDLYVAQDGAMVPFAEKDGVLVFQLASRPFQLGTTSHQVNLCLSEVPAPEIRYDPQGFKASCLSGPMQAAREPSAANLVVYPGTRWSDGNVVLQEGSQLAAKPLPGYPRAYQVNALSFVDRKEAELSTFRGTIHGWVVVYHQAERTRRDVMPIQLVFAGPKAP